MIGMVENQRDRITESVGYCLEVSLSMESFLNRNGSKVQKDIMVLK